jgi:hypothetical protein
MRQLGIICCLLAFTLIAGAHRTSAQTSSAVQSVPSSTFNVSVDEVSLTFHAADQQGLPVTDLKPSDLIIYDNDRLPRKILAFQALQDAPIRAGILLDTSASMEGSISHDRAVSTEYVERLLRPKTDLAFIEYFGYIPRIVQPWTGNQTALARDRRSYSGPRQPPRGNGHLRHCL